MTTTPSETVVDKDLVFTITIFIEPGQPVKGLEGEIYFNPHVFQIINITEGDFFSPHPTYFKNGTIDNVNGTVKKLYSVILGQFNTTVNGNFVSINISAVNESYSYIILNKWGVCNETQYVGIETNNGRIIVKGDYYPYDLNEDGITNFLDVSIFVVSYGGTGEPGWVRSDIDDTGLIDYRDVSILVGNYLK